MPSSHDYIKDRRNKNIKIFVNDKFYTREKAKVSVFDSPMLVGCFKLMELSFPMETLYDFVMLS